MLFCFIRNEHRFLLAGLKLPRLADWTARQAAYLDAAKSFVLKLNPEFTSIEVTFVKAINIGKKEDPRLFLSVDCKTVEQSATVRSYWGQLMRNGTARRDFSDIQVHNVVTLATRVRIHILKVIFMYF
jgi:hypothetical protein